MICLSDVAMFRWSFDLEVLRRALLAEAEAPQEQVNIGQTEHCQSKKRCKLSRFFLYFCNLCATFEFPRLKPCQPSDITDEELRWWTPFLAQRQKLTAQRGG